MFTKEGEGDGKEIKLKISQTNDELRDLDKQIKFQEAEITRQRRNYLDLDNRLNAIRVEYKKKHPMLKLQTEQKVVDELRQLTKAFDYK